MSELENSVGEDLPFEEGEDQGGGIEFAPVPGRGLGELEHHDQAGLPGSIPFATSVTQSNGRKGTFNGVGCPQVPPVLRWAVVEGESGITILREGWSAGPSHPATRAYPMTRSQQIVLKQGRIGLVDG